MDEIRCERCHQVLEIGMYPYCKGDPKDHGTVFVGKSSVFPFECPHVNGKPMVIESMHHLRQVEKQYGVVFSSFSKSNVRDLDPIRDLPRYRGDDPDTRHR